MKTQTLTKNACFAALTCMTIALLLTGCSDEKEKKQATAPVKTVFNPFDHTHDMPVTDVQKHKFEHDFAAQCVDRELKNSVNKEEDKQRFSTSCLCIADYMMKDLTAQEAEKFLSEHENPRSLQIKYDAAVYHCTQAKTTDKGFKTFEAPKPKEEKGFLSKFF